MDQGSKKIIERFGLKEISGDPSKVAEMIKTISLNLACLLDEAEKYDKKDEAAGNKVIVAMAFIKKQVLALTGEQRKPAGLLRQRMYQLNGTVNVKSGKFFLAKNEERPLDMDINK